MDQKYGKESKEKRKRKVQKYNGKKKIKKCPIKTISSIAPTFGNKKTKEYLKKLENKRKK